MTSTITHPDHDDLCAIITLQRALILGDLCLDRFLHGMLEHARRLCGAEGAVLELADGEERAAAATPALKAPGTRRHPARWRDEEVRSMACVPVASGDAAVGVLRVLSPRARAFSTTDLATLHGMARVIASAIAGAGH